MSGNKNPDAPNLTMENGVIEVSVYKMDSGFLLHDYSTRKKHSIRSSNELKDAIQYAIDGAFEEITKVLNDKEVDERVDFSIVLMSNPDEAFEEEYEMQDNYSLDQIAELFNTVLQGGGATKQSGFNFRPNPRTGITAEDIATALKNKGFIKSVMKIKQGKDPNRQHEPSGNKPPKTFYHDNSKNKEKGQGGQGTTKLKPTNIE